MLATKNISKTFAGVTALNGVDLELHPGKVNAIIGENGAGKSTLMKILSGVYPDYEGTILWQGQPVRFSGTRDAEQAGIAIIHQELNLVPYLSIAENIFLGRELTTAWGMLDKKEMRRKTRVWLEKLKLSADPDHPVAALKVGEQQLIEIARALQADAQVIIMDEPTSAISEKEIVNLFAIIGGLRAEGKTIVYISHKLNELFALADRYIVMRDGSVIGSGDMQHATPEAIIQKMTGRKIDQQRNERTSSLQPLLQIKDLALRGAQRNTPARLHGISFQLGKGEILGIYGLMGSGRTELLETIFGLHPRRCAGELFINNQRLSCGSPAMAIRAGIALVPEDRKGQGLILDQDIRSNISITILQQLEKWGIFINRAKEMQLSRDYIQRLAIKTSSPYKKACELSGGNQQKIVLAKWLATRPQVLLLDEPTRGIDINAKYEIYDLMRQLAADGMGIIMVSSELPEILAVSDRVLVMAEGRLTADLPVQDATESSILKHAIQKN
ncbi:MAG: sugar ABC transporter ATP-binding protein [Chitinophagaceae bacterium]